MLDVKEEVIEGLYAAGEVVGGFHGLAPMTGASLGMGALLGREAARRSM
ncbi:FAD-binding protein [Nocardia zapadnayensis]|nr:FAD-binding protein [Nocardia zapadnayensis]